MKGQNYRVQEAGPLLEQLLKLFPERSRTSIKTMLSKGQILVGGESVTAFDHPLRKGDTITVLQKGISIAHAMRSDAGESVE